MATTDGLSAVEFGPFYLDLRTGELSRGGQRIRLPEQSFQILAALVAQPGEVVSREDLQKRLWSNDTFVDFEVGLNNAVKRLRDALIDSAERPRYIETVPRRGYRFIAALQTTPLPTPAENAQPSPQLSTEISTSDAPVPEFEGSRLRRSLWPLFLLSSLLVVSVIGGVLMWWRASYRPKILSIAVLPLKNLSGDKSQDYFADGMTNAITTQLAQVSALRVVASAAANQYTASSLPQPEIANKLKADALIEGTIERQGDHIRINAKLLDPSGHRYLWGQTFDRSMDDLLGLESDVARQITAHVRATLTPAEKLRLERDFAVDPAAYDLYLQAKYYAQHLNPADNDRAIDFLQRSLARDSRFAPAYAAIAYEYRTRGEELHRNNEELRRNAFVAAERCIEFDPELADCYAVRATLLWTPSNGFPHASAVADLKHALALNPNFDEAHHQLAYIYNHIGLLEEAQKHLEAAELLNPVNPGTRFRVAVNLIYQGRYQEALARIRESKRFQPSLWAYQTSFSLVQLGRREEARRVLQAAETDDKTETAALLRSMEAVLAAADGDAAIAHRKIAESVSMGRGFQHFHHSEYAIAEAYALLNEKRNSVEWLRRAATDGFPCYPLFARDASLAHLRGDPLFGAFLEELKVEWIRNKQTLR